MCELRCKVGDNARSCSQEPLLLDNGIVRPKTGRAKSGECALFSETVWGNWGRKSAHTVGTRDKRGLERSLVARTATIPCLVW